MQDTLDTLESRLAALNRNGEETPEKVDVLIGIARALRSDDLQRTVRLAQEAYELAVRLSYRQGEAHGLSMLGYAAYLKSEHETAYAHLRAALALFETLADPWGKARALHGLALLQMSLGDYEQSLTNDNEALTLFRQLGDAAEQVWTLLSVGTCYTDLGDYDRALQVFEEAYALLEGGVEDDVARARVLNGIGTAYHHLGDYEKALGYHQQSLALFEAKRNQMGEARALNDLGLVYAHLGDEEHALDCHRRSLLIREAMGTRQAQSTSLIHLGNLYLQRGEVEQALDYLHRALAIAEATRVRPRIYQAHLGLAEAYERQGLPAEALVHYKAYHQVREEVLGEEARMKLNTMQIRFEVQKAEQAAEIERLRNVDLKEKNDELHRVLQALKKTQAQLVQQEKLASLGALTAGIAHEIKNPLNFVNNFAALSRELADELEEELRAGIPLEEIQTILADLKSNAAKIEEHGRRADAIIRSMMQHARGGTGERQPLDLNALVDEYVELAYHGKRAQTPAFSVAVVKDLGEAVGPVTAVPQDLGRVLLNLIGNAFDAVHERAAAHEGTYQPTVTVSTRQADGRAVIRISDNGPGIPPAIREKIFEPFFTTKPTGSGTGLGLSLSYDIVTQGHGGTLAVESEEGRGSTFIVTLPADAGGTASRA